MKPTKIGVIGCGTICGIYFTSLRKFPTVEVAACADIDIKKAKAKAAEFSVPRACTVDELLADKDISLVVNLTIPVVHAEVSIRALNAGKHVYSEKPLATTRKDAARVIEVAKRKKLRIGCAPDTVLGGGIQTCKKIIDDGWIGKPVAATAFMMGHGPEAWHPNPFFFYFFIFTHSAHAVEFRKPLPSNAFFVSHLAARPRQRKLGLIDGGEATETRIITNCIAGPVPAQFDRQVTTGWRAGVNCSPARSTGMCGIQREPLWRPLGHFGNLYYPSRISANTARG